MTPLLRFESLLHHGPKLKASLGGPGGGFGGPSGGFDGGGSGKPLLLLRKPAPYNLQKNLYTVLESL